MKEPVKLYISSGWHLTNPESRYRSMVGKTDHLDAIFVEGVYFDASSNSEAALNWIAFLIALVSMRIYLFLLGKIAPVIGRTDQNLIDRLEEEYNAEIVEVDENVHKLLTEGRILWGSGHWTIAWVAFAAIPTWMNYATPKFEAVVTYSVSVFPNLTSPIFLAVLVLEILVLILFAGAGILGLFIAGTMSSRNSRMVSSIEEFASDNPGAVGCLIVGSKHTEGIESLIDRSDFIELAD